MPAPQDALRDMPPRTAFSRASRSCRHLTAIAALALLCLALVPGTALGSQEITLTEAASGRTINVAVGDTIVVAVESNASTGYHWVVAAAPAAAILQAAADSGEYTAPTSDLLGAPGTQTFRFRAAGQGTTKLALSYVAPGTNEVGKAFELTIEVAAAPGVDALPATGTDSSDRGSGTEPLAALVTLCAGAAACVFVARIRAAHSPA